MIPVGSHKARAVEAALGYTANGNDQVGVLFEVTEGPHQGKQSTWYGYFTEKSMRRTIESLKYCGWAGDWSTWAGLTDNEVTIKVELDRDQDGAVKTLDDGTQCTRIAFVNGSGGIAMKSTMDVVQQSEFAARMKGIVFEVLGGQKPTAPARTAAPRTAPGPAARAPLPPNGRPAHSSEWDGTGPDPNEDQIPFVTRGSW